MKVFGEANFYAFRLYLKGEALMLVDDEPTILFDFIAQFIIDRTARDVEGYNCFIGIIRTYSWGSFQ